jgi:arylsulfatase A-like enzyme
LEAASNPKRGQAGNWELYNLAKDISETNNLADRQPDKLAALIKVWERLNGEMMDPIWRP